MSGNTYGPTYAVTSRSSGSWSPPGSSRALESSVTARTLPRPHRFQLVVAGAQALREHPDLGYGGHGVRVAAPPRQHVDMKMPWDPRAPGVSADCSAGRPLATVTGPGVKQRPHPR